MARILAVDYGLKRCGIAVTDPLQMIANSLATVATTELIFFLEKYLQNQQVETIVLGYPRKMNNQPSDTAPEVEKLAAKLRNKFPLVTVSFTDERFTSKIAFQSMIDGGVKKQGRQNKAMVDAVAATLILQSYLEAKRFKNNAL